ncbi:sensor domain-containing protein [Nocardiopsis sp. HNM0947]|uniref:histidine kinase n=1 Tax=Nocardiopsis coralli TaxID=2772213 RepID=A0ABR9P3B5_9ACTN|nr:histidine kinase [Nocardiopsis coralli]MBE2998343.1 sensor domain-containing protein [Nocardiopsis coralli]
MTVRTLRAAITLAPHRFLLSAWPWRALAYLASGLVAGSLLYGTVHLLAVHWPEQGRQWQILALPLGMLFLAAVLGSTPLVVRWGRWCEGLVGEQLEPPPETAPSGAGRWARLRARAFSTRTWRDVGYTVLALSVLYVLDLAVLVVALGSPLAGVLNYWGAAWLRPAEWVASVAGWASLWLVGLYLVAAWASARSEIVRAVLSPREERLAAELRDVTTSRAALAEAFDDERRRIERDLHDGAQQRLVAVKTALGLARLDLPDGSPAAGAVREAQDQVTAALSELRDLVRGIHPQVLTERGLRAALLDVAARASSPVSVEFDPPDRLPPAVESTAYFVVCEALANAAKHAPGAPVRVSGDTHDGTLRVDVTDEGPGGADPDGGGLGGLRHRLAVLDGVLTVHSPEGGPTTVRLEIPQR